MAGVEFGLGTGINMAGVKVTRGSDYHTLDNRDKMQCSCGCVSGLVKRSVDSVDYP